MGEGAGNRVGLNQSPEGQGSYVVDNAPFPENTWQRVAEALRTEDESVDVGVENVRSETQSVELAASAAEGAGVEMDSARPSNTPGRSEINSGLGGGTQADALIRQMAERWAREAEAEAGEGGMVAGEAGAGANETGGEFGVEAGAEAGIEAETEVEVEPARKVGEAALTVVESEGVAEATTGTADAVSERRALGEEKFAEWQKTVAQPIDQYWDGLNQQMWGEYGVEIGNKAPELTGFSDKLAKVFLRGGKQIGPSALAVRVDMAEKMALKSFAQRKAETLQDTKPQPQGFFGFKGYKRSVPKGFDADLVTVLRGSVAQGVMNKYYGNEQLMHDVSAPELSQAEKMAWWEMMEPEDAKLLEEVAPQPEQGELGQQYELIKSMSLWPKNKTDLLGVRDFVDSLYSETADRLAQESINTPTYDEMHGILDRLVTTMVELTAKVRAVDAEREALGEDRQKVAAEYESMINLDNLMLEKLRSSGVIAREGTLAEQGEALKSIEEEALSEMAECSTRKERAKSEQNQVEYDTADREYNYYRDLLEQIFPAKRALMLEQKRLDKAAEDEAEPEATGEADRAKRTTG